MAGRLKAPDAGAECGLDLQNHRQFQRISSPAGVAKAGPKRFRAGVAAAGASLASAGLPNAPALNRDPVAAGAAVVTIFSQWPKL